MTRTSDTARSRISEYRLLPRRIVAGVMSGTSLDAVDVAVVELGNAGDGFTWRVLGFTSAPFSPELRERLMAACSGVLAMRGVFTLHAELGGAYARAIANGLLECAEVDHLDAIGLHGQTVFHAPAQGDVSVTVQIGSGAVVAQALDTIVVDDFRSNDVAAGGQGAPLVPYCDYLMLRATDRSRVVLNVGGIANLTWIPRGCTLDSLVAFDTGPGNMLIDGAMRMLYGSPYDANGAVAGSSRPDERWLRRLMEDAYFAMMPPKSTGREQYGEDCARRLVDEARSRGLEPSTIIATLTALTARSIAAGCREHAAAGAPVDEMIVSGGGAGNETLLRMLASELAGTRVMRSDDVGIPAQAKEAICFAVLADHALREIPANVPSVTGARKRVVCGAVRVP